MSYDSVHKLLVANVRKRIQAEKDHLSWSRAQILEFQEIQLQKLLKHVLHHSPYYRERLKKMKKLSDIKPTTKQDVMNNWDDIICIPGLTKSSAENYLTQLQNREITNPFFKDYYYITESNHASGLRGLFVWDVDYFSVVGYAALRYQHQDELLEGIEGKKIAALMSSNLIDVNLPLFTITLEDESEILAIPVDAPLEEIIKQLNEFQPTHLIGYHAVITKLAEKADDGKLSISPKRISIYSESVERDVADSRMKIQKAWDAEINSMWSNVEMGIIGVENDAHCGLFLSEDLLIIEPVNENLKPVKKATDAKKLLMTNLFNFTFPLIRYVVDDPVTIEAIKSSAYLVAR